MEGTIKANSKSEITGSRRSSWLNFLLSVLLLFSILGPLLSAPPNALAADVWENLKTDQCSLNITDNSARNFTGASGRVYQFTNFTRADRIITLNFKVKANASANLQDDSYIFTYSSVAKFVANHNSHRAVLTVFYDSGYTGAFVSTADNDPNKEWFERINRGGITLTCQSNGSNPPGTPNPGTTTTYTEISSCRIQAPVDIVRKEIASNGRVINIGLITGQNPTVDYVFEYSGNSSAPAINQGPLLLYKIQTVDGDPKSNQVIVGGTTIDTYLMVRTVGNTNMYFVNGTSALSPISVNPGNPNQYTYLIKYFYDISASIKLNCKIFDGAIAASTVQFEAGNNTTPPTITLPANLGPDLHRPKSKFKLGYVITKGGVGTINENLFYFIFDTALDNAGDPTSSPDDTYTKLAVRVSPIEGKVYAVHYGALPEYIDDSDNISTPNREIYGFSEITGVNKGDLYSKLVNWTYKEKTGSGGECAKTTGPQDAAPKADLEKATWATSETPNDDCIMLNGVEGFSNVPATPIGWLARWGVKGNKAGLLGPTTVDTGLCGGMLPQGGGILNITAILKYAVCWIISQVYELGDALFIGGAKWLESSIGLQFSG